MTDIDSQNWQKPEAAPKDGTWMLTHSVGDGLPYDHLESYDFHAWDASEGAFRKFRHSVSESHWDKVIEWIPWQVDLYAEYETFLKLMYDD